MGDNTKSNANESINGIIGCGVRGLTYIEGSDNIFLGLAAATGDEVEVAVSAARAERVELTSDGVPYVSAARVEYIRGEIYKLVEEMDGSCSSGHISHVEACIRGLVWALNGEDPESFHRRPTVDIFNAAGIPVLDHGDVVEVSNEWLVAHGIEPVEDETKRGLGGFLVWHTELFEGTKPPADAWHVSANTGAEAAVKYAQECFDKAEKVPSSTYTDPLFVDGAGAGDIGDGFFSDEEALRHHYEQEGEPLPAYVWACEEERLTFDAVHIIEDACEQQVMHESAEESVTHEAGKELQDFLDGWAKRHPVISWKTDYSRAVILEVKK